MGGQVEGDLSEWQGTGSGQHVWGLGDTRGTGVSTEGRWAQRKQTPTESRWLSELSPGVSPPSQSKHKCLCVSSDPREFCLC